MAPAILGTGALVSTFTAAPGRNQFSLALSTGIFISSGPVQFADGTMQFSAFVPSSNSTTTVVPSQTLPASPSTQCLIGSTVTLTMARNDTYMGIFFLAAAFGDAGSDPTGVFNILIDGKAVPGLPPLGNGLIQSPIPAAGANVSFFQIPPNQGLQGTRRICVIASNSSGPPPNITIQSNSASAALFGAFEIK